MDLSNCLHHTPAKSGSQCTAALSAVVVWVSGLSFCILPKDSFSHTMTLRSLMLSVTLLPSTVVKRLSADDHGVDMPLLPSFLKNVDHVVLKDVVPERIERGCAVLDDEDAMFG